MHFMLAITVLAAAMAITNAAESKFGAGREMAGVLLKTISNSQDNRAVVVENWSGYPVRLWCASKNDRIRRNGLSYVDLKDQQAMGWSFTPNVFPGFSGRTLFWCTFCYKNKRRGWNVYDQGWEKLDNDGIPKNGLCQWRIIRESVRWLQESTPRRGWDFASWTPQGNC